MKKLTIIILSLIAVVMLCCETEEFNIIMEPQVIKDTTHNYNIIYDSINADSNVIPVDCIDYASSIYNHLWLRHFSVRNGQKVDDVYWQNLWNGQHSLEDFYHDDLFLWSDDYGYFHIDVRDSIYEPVIIETIAFDFRYYYDSCIISGNYMTFYSNLYGVKNCEIIQAGQHTLIIRYESIMGNDIKICFYRSDG